MSQNRGIVRLAAIVTIAVLGGLANARLVAGLRSRGVNAIGLCALDAGMVEVDLHADKSEYFLSARLNVSIPGVERSVAQALVDDAKEICPYSKATKGNIAVTYTVV